MSKITNEYNALYIDQIREIRGHKFSNLQRGTNKIPEKSGVYVWRYWPSFQSIEYERILGVVESLQKYFPRNIENLSNSRIRAILERTPFGGINDERFLGVKNKIKIDNILKLLKEDANVRQAFAHTLEILVSSSPPLYIGKAVNLKFRLIEHFDKKTSLLEKIESAGISKNDVYISFILDDLTKDFGHNEATSTIEEILQRLTNPVFSERYG